MAVHNDFGRWGEQVAEWHLRQQGYAICHRNWRLGHRDIDIVAVDPTDQTLVFVEVKSRSGTDYQQPEEAVDWRKMRNLATAANAYVKRYRIDCAVRFDIVTVTATVLGQPPAIDHIRDAFRPY